jgi:DNA modification methylase
MTPYYQDDAVTIYHGDCRDINAWDIAGGVMVTDPPYGIAYESNMHGHGLDTATTANRAVSIVGDESTELRDDVLQRWGSRPALVFGSWKAPRPATTRHILTWVKGDHLGMGDLSIPWRPNTEEIYVIGTGFTGHRGTSCLSYPGPVTWASKGRSHPHEKPVDLLRDLIGKCPPLAEVVDPFMGSGSTLRAAKDLGRRAIGIEISEAYCEIASNRMAQEVLDFGAA